MIKQEQTILSDKEKGIKGNCLITTYACYLDFKVDDCPQIQYLFDCKKPNGFWHNVLTLWLEELGYKEVSLTEDPFLSNGFEDFYFAWGESQRGIMHQVIYKEGKLFHDPHPSKSGIKSEKGYIILEKIK